MASLRNYVLALAFAITTISPRFALTQSTQLASATTTVRLKQCYLPNGHLSDDVPCDPNAEHSMCCPSPDRCLSNGLCITRPDRNNSGPDIGDMYARGTCTDPFWGDKRCPQHCLDNPDSEFVATAPNFKAGGVMVYGCERQGYGAPAAYCCESLVIPKECCNPTVMFSLPAATIGNALPIQTYPAEGDNPATVSKYTGTYAVRFSRTSSTSSTTTPNGTPATTPPPTGLPSDSPDSNSGGLSDSAKVGLGVGLGIGGALFLIGLAFLYFYRRSHPATKNEESAESNNNNPNNDVRSPSITSVTSGTTAAGHGTNGVWVDGRFYPAADNNAELGNFIYAKELETRKSLKELDGQIMAREVHTWEHTPAELPVDGHQAGWGQVEERERVGAEQGDEIKGSGGVVQVGEVSPLSPAPVKPEGATTAYVPVGDEQTLPQQQQQSQEGEKAWGPSESRWEGVARGRNTQGIGTG